MSRKPKTPFQNYEESPPTVELEVGVFSLRPSPYRLGYIWIEKADGEGMELPIHILEQELYEIYCEHF